MRNIKFRAWNKIHKRFEHFELPKGRILSLTRPDMSDADVYEDWLQFTGLLDKNGKEIYEGDILKLTHYDFIKERLTDIIGKVEWKEAGMYIKGIFEPKDRKYQDYSFLFPYPSQYKKDGKIEWEILGNIYENPVDLKKRGE